jgi:hypothetical protein
MSLECKAERRFRCLPSWIMDNVAVFPPLPSVGLGRAWHVLEGRLHGFVLSAPCGFLQADMLCETTETSRAKLTTLDAAIPERRCCRHCLTALRSDAGQRSPS